MSNHFEKYPGLYSGAKAAGINYMTALQRVRGGMTVEQALAIPAGTRKRKSWKTQISLTEREAKYLSAWTNKSRLPIWERPAEWVATPPKPPKLLRPTRIVTLNDAAPAHIQRIRAALCDGFVKTGDLDEGLLAQLKGYAHECRTAKKHLAGVPDEHASRRYGREATCVGDDGHRDATQIDPATAERITEFLRT
jgi:hypothetical protein